MKKVKLMFDFGEGPIWNEYFDEKSLKTTTGIDEIDNNLIRNYKIYILVIMNKIHMICLCGLIKRNKLKTKKKFLKNYLY